MGMIVTLYLISANVYNSVDTTENMGFSYVEIWMLGTQFPILLALFEYGFVLYLKKIAKQGDGQIQVPNQLESNLDDKIKWLDFITMIISFVCFIIFASLYWIILLLER